MIHQTTVVGSARPVAAQFSRARVAVRSRATVIRVSNKLVLQPTGAGTDEHLDEKCPQPGPIELKEGSYELGRSDDVAIKLDIPTVSLRHAIIRIEGNKVLITDLKSTNGTTIEGSDIKPMTETALEVGQEVIFGDEFLTKFKLAEEGDAKEA